MDLAAISVPRPSASAGEKFRFNPEAMLAAVGAFLGGTLLLRILPSLQFEVFARGAAKLAGLFTATLVSPGENGWMLPLASAPVAVTTACSATDYFLIVASLVGFQATRLGVSWFTAAGLGLIAAAPLAILVNAVRIVTVAYAHPLLISRLPATYESFLHMAVGAAVFLPSLILLNVFLEAYGRHRSPRLHAVRV
jgi:exosortase/archaeosortase family protein